MSPLHQVHHHLLIGIQSHGIHLGDGLCHIRAAAQLLYCLLPLADGLVIARGVLVANGDEQPSPVGILPPLGPGVLQLVFFRQSLLPLHEAVEHLEKILHVLVGGGGRI